MEVQKGALAEPLYAKAVRVGTKRDADGEKLYTYRITTEVIDRQNEVVTLDGWYFDNFHKNPVILDSHNYFGIEHIVGRGVGGVSGDPAGQGYLLDIRFNSSPKGKLAKLLADEDNLKAVSVGFRSLERAFGSERNEPMKHTKKELLEVSVVGVPANHEALQVRGLGMDFDALAEKLVAVLTAKGVVTAGDLTTQTPPPAAEGEDDMPARNDGESLADYAKRLMGEVKAGRSLSKKNEDALRQASDLLAGVLASVAAQAEEGAKSGAEDTPDDQETPPADGGAGDEDSNPPAGDGEGKDAATETGGDEGGDPQGDAGAFNPAEETLEVLRAFVAAKN